MEVAMVYKVEDNEDLEVTGRILDILRDARQMYAGGLGSEGWWDGAVDYILNGNKGGDGEDVRNDSNPPTAWFA